MQEVLENMVKDFASEIAKDRDEMLNNTNVPDLLRYIKFQRTLAENYRLNAEKILAKLIERIPDASEEFAEYELTMDASDFARIVETYDYVINLIESGKFAKEV